MFGNQCRKLLETFGVASSHVLIEAAAQVPREQSAKRQDGREDHAEQQQRQRVDES